MKTINKTKGTVICEKTTLADTILSRLVGLLNRRFLDPSEGLVITQCRSIHMFFMRFPIDVIFIDKNNQVVGLVKEIKPFFMSPYFIKATRAIEVFPGTISSSKTEKGDMVVFEG